MEQLNMNVLKNQIIELIDKKSKKYGITGCSIALVDGEETVWAQGFGFADKERSLEATDRTRFLVASMTKVFTGTAVMRLADRGLIDIDKPVKEYIPEFSYKSRFADTGPITVRSLMTHHSGLSGDNFDKFYNEDPEDPNNTFRMAVDYLKENYVAYPPNYVWSYSNLGTDLLGVIIERVSGMDYCTYLQESILKPLKMSDSATVADKTARDSMAKVYDKGKYEEEHYLRDLPAGSVISTVSDMANFIKMVLGGGEYAGSRILSEDALNEMFTVQNSGVNLDNGFKMGLSWILEWPLFDYAGKVCWHDGSSVHYNGIMVVLPDQKLGVVMLSNSSTALPVFLREIVEETLIQAMKTKTDLLPDIRHKASAKAIPETELAGYEGRYASIMGMMDVRRRKSGLVLNMSGTDFNMVLNNDGWFSLRLSIFGFPIKVKKLQNIRVGIMKTEAGRVFSLEQTVSRHQFKQTIGQEYSERHIPERWQNRTGEYTAEDKENSFIKSIELVCSRGVLSIKASARKLGKLNFILGPLSNNEAVILGLGRFAGETISSEDRDKVCLKVFGLRFIKL